MTGLIMTNEQMEENSGIIDYSFINIWSAGGCAAVFACIAAFKKSYRIEGYLLEVLP
ncbi:hypothetical protein [Sporofaciens sp. JLR.KK001]|jgi:hypothetical protein|uniref:hypothetical protein n=1 Tax=Sporofaciens sp. JLR.KK001 TaxID=3112621 RepID=UPI002FF1730B